VKKGNFQGITVKCDAADHALHQQKSLTRREIAEHDADSRFIGSTLGFLRKEEKKPSLGQEDHQIRGALPVIVNVHPPALTVPTGTFVREI
jgi:hypothetical protein